MAPVEWRTHVWSLAREIRIASKQRSGMRSLILALILCSCIVTNICLRAQAPIQAPVTSPAAPVPANPRAFLDTYCITCHNQKLHTAGLALDTLDVTHPGVNPDVWERVVAKLRAG